MPYGLSVKLKVKDYAKWKSEFDGAAALRKAGGEKSYQLFRAVDDPNTLVLLCEWESLDKLREYMASADLQKAMQQAGVTDPGEQFELEELDKGTL